MSLAIDPADDDALNCPLCGYDLRGLPEHRCPECGYAFDPEALRREKDERRNWFFEHASRRPLRSFALTTVSSLWPPDLWRRLSAAHAIDDRRLGQWCRIWLAIGTSSAGLTFAIACFRLRRPWGAIFSPRGRSQLPTWGAVVVHAARDAVARGAIASIVAAALWPLAAASMLALLGTTLFNVRVGRGHVVRALAYAMPLTLTPVIGAALYTTLTSRQLGGIRSAYSIGLLDEFGLDRAAANALIASALCSTFHLATANARYLRIPRPWSTAAIIQTAAWLAILVVLRVLFANGV